MRLIDAEALIREMCEGCDGMACDGQTATGQGKCYAIRKVEEARSIEIMIKQSRGRYGRGLARYE